MKLSLPRISGRVVQLDLKVVVALLTVYVVWGSTYFAIKLALQSFPPFLMTGVRFLLAGSVLLIGSHLGGAPLPTRTQWRNAAVIGALLLVCGMGGTAFAEQYVDSGITAVAVATIPIWSALFAGLWGQWPVRNEWVGLLVGFAGVALLTLGSNLRATPLGAIALLVAPLCWAFGSILSRRLVLPAGSMGFAAEMLCGGCVLIVLGLLRREHLLGPIVASAVWAWLYLVVVGSLGAFSAYMYLLKHVRPTLATSYAYVNPVIAVGLGVGLGGEKVTSLSYLAMVVILVGVILVAVGRERG